MTVTPFFTIVTVIFPGERGILSFETPAATLVNVWEELPTVSVTVLVEVEKTTTQRVSWTEAGVSSVAIKIHWIFTGVQSYPSGRPKGSEEADAEAGWGRAQ